MNKSGSSNTRKGCNSPIFNVQVITIGAREAIANDILLNCSYYYKYTYSQNATYNLKILYGLVRK